MIKLVNKDFHRVDKVIALGLSIDQYPSQDFNLGSNGLPANDLTLLEKAQSMQEVQLIMSRLDMYKAQNPSSDRTDREILQDIVPRWVQSPAEIDRFMDYYYSKVEDRLGKVINPDVDKSIDSKVSDNASSQSSTSE